ncbi:MAG: DUF262 domain-containing protein [Lachnospiraceae bacterium]|nr:DUF262 domain-containing protein [Lachnospiraceae bacterium]
MIRTTLNWTVKNLKSMYDEKETLSFNHPIQRQSAQWDNEQQSLLIHSMLANFPVPAVYVHKTESIEVDAKGKHSYTYSVLDGKQRMTTVFSFINGEYALSEDIPDVEIEDVTYEIAGKYFEDLDEDVQQEILRFRFNIQAFEDVTDEMIEDIFFRLNNSTPLTKSQKARPLMGVENSIFINDILAGRFFTEKCTFSKMQLKRSDDMCTLLQGMMLLDNKYRDYDFSSISADEVMNYSQYIKNNYPDECKDRLKRIIGFLNNVFYMKDKNLKKVNIPVLFLIADKALAESITGTNFRRWYNSFFEEHKKEYNLYCSSGSIKKEKTLGRIEIMTRYFDEYFRELNSQNATESPLESSDTSLEVISDEEISVPVDGSDTGSALEDTPVSDNTDNEVPTETESGESILVESESA